MRSRMALTSWRARLAIAALLLLCHAMTFSMGEMHRAMAAVRTRSYRLAKAHFEDAHVPFCQPPIAAVPSDPDVRSASV